MIYVYPMYFACYHQSVFSGILLCRGVITVSTTSVVATYVLL